MKINVTFKTPGIVDDAVADAVAENLPVFEFEEDKFEMTNNVENEVRNFLEKYIEYGEYVTIEFDTEMKTVQVLPV